MRRPVRVQQPFRLAPNRTATALLQDKRSRTTAAANLMVVARACQRRGSHNKTLVLTGGLWYPLTGLVDGCRPQHSSTLGPKEMIESR